MNVPEILERKRDGRENETDEIAAIVRGAVDGTIPEYQISAWLMAVLFRGMSPRETADLTRLMMESGDVWAHEDLGGVPLDKHSTGGVGDKITIPLAPLVASVGVKIPMISGRGLGHTGGTLDKLESIPGLRTDLDASEFRATLLDVGFAIAGASRQLAPADAKLYALRDVTGTVPSIPLITASILSKKYAAGVEALVLDVKSGSGAFMRERAAAVDLARVLVAVSRAMGKRAVALVTRMDEPLGLAVGNALEIRESLDVLRGEGPEDIVDLTLALGAEMVVLAGLAGGRDEARTQLEASRRDGRALATFRRWVERQGGNPAVVDDDSVLPAAPVRRDVESPLDGVLVRCDAREIGFAANALGAGRTKVGESVDPAVGIVFARKTGDRVARGQTIATVHARSEAAAAAAAARVVSAWEIGEAAASRDPLILETLE
ncbi:MAG: thymidine phosphorylase [bacterium]